MIEYILCAIVVGIFFVYINSRTLEGKILKLERKIETQEKILVQVIKNPLQAKRNLKKIIKQVKI